MNFNDTTNNTGLIQECEDLTQIGAAGISGNTTLLKQFTRRINTWNDKVQTMILEVQDEWDYDDSNHTNFPILTTDLVANQQDYALPTSTLQVKRAEISFDGSKWYKLAPFDINEMTDDSSTTSIASNFNKTEPYYDLQYGSIFLYPIPDSNVTGGLKLWITRENELFTTADTTQEPGFDRQFHEILALGASYDYCKSKNLPQLGALKNDLLELEQRLRRYYASKQKDRNLTMKSQNINYE